MGEARQRRVTRAGAGRVRGVETGTAAVAARRGTGAQERRPQVFGKVGRSGHRNQYESGLDG
jgi:hypothetical protein